MATFYWMFLSKNSSDNWLDTNFMYFKELDIAVIFCCVLNDQILHAFYWTFMTVLVFVDMFTNLYLENQMLNSLIWTFKDLLNNLLWNPPDLNVYLRIVRLEVRSYLFLKPLSLKFTFVLGNTYSWVSLL